MDNSKSIQLVDTLLTNNIITKIYDFYQTQKTDLDLFSFSDSVRDFNFDQKPFTGKSTNFENVFSFLSENSNDLSTITIISDGNSNSGKSFNKKTEYINTPIFTVGLGESVKTDDLLIKKINHSSFIYTDVKTKIEVVIETNTFGKNVNVSMLVAGKIAQTKNIKLQNQFTEIGFEFSPSSPGKKRISFSVTQLENEKNINNNFKSAVINVLNDKIKIGLVTGSLSNDYRFIKNILKNDDKKKLIEFVKISDEITKGNLSELSNCDALILTGFPSSVNSDREITAIKNLIFNKKIPFFFSFGAGVNYEKLEKLSVLLPFSFNIPAQINYNLVTTEIKNFNSPLIKTTTGNLVQTWQNLPPIIQPEIGIKSSPGSDIILVDESSEIPLLITSNVTGIKSVNLLASAIWKWQLNNSPNSDLLENFLNSSVKWLVADDELNNISVRTTKNIFDTGEPVVFSAKVYSETFDPLSDAEVEITIKKNGDLQKLTLQPESTQGSYGGSLELNKSGKYNYTANVTRNNKSLFSKKGSFEISDTDIEFISSGLNRGYLENISRKTNGKYFSANEISSLLNQIKMINQKNQIIIDEQHSIS
ncbi:MAG: hypothetical protein ACEPO8_15755, partial [Rhodothermaceae bacterium]